MAPEVVVLGDGLEWIEQRFVGIGRKPLLQRGLQRFYQMAKPDRVLLVVWKASMGRLVDGQAGPPLERCQFGESRA